MVWYHGIQEFANTPVKMRMRSILMKDERVMFCMMQHYPVPQHFQGINSIDNVLGIVKQSADLALRHCTAKGHLRRILLMLQGRLIFGTPHTQIMAISFAAGMASCDITQHQALCIGLIIIHFSLQGLAKVCRLVPSSGSNL
jgi:hypothetical protein